MNPTDPLLLYSVLAAASSGLALVGAASAWPLSWRRHRERIAGILVLAAIAVAALAGAIGPPGIGVVVGLPCILLAAGLLIRQWFGQQHPQDDAEMAGKLREELLLREDSEQRLRKALAQYRRSAADFEQFAYAASHDLQAPLHNIEGFARLLKQRCQTIDDAEMRMFVGQIVDGVHQTQALVEALLQLSRIGRRDARVEAKPLGEAFAQALERLGGEIAISDAQIHVAELPSIEADHALLVQLFQNLIANALKYQPAGQIPRLDVTARQERDDWHLVFTDNGIGIPAEQVDHVFAPLQRLHAQSQFSGSGMGLAICRKIAAYHDGEIWAEPHDGGAQIHVLLPGRARPQGRKAA